MRVGKRCYDTFLLEAFVSPASQMVGQLVERDLPGLPGMPVFPKSRLDAFEVDLQLFGGLVKTLALVYDPVLEIAVASPEVSQNVGGFAWLLSALETLWQSSVS